jgi:hypothetical protein
VRGEWRAEKGERRSRAKGEDESQSCNHDVSNSGEQLPWHIVFAISVFLFFDTGTTTTTTELL